jgi:hypothetical protein
VRRLLCRRAWRRVQVPVCNGIRPLGALRADQDLSHHASLVGSHGLSAIALQPRSSRHHAGHLRTSSSERYRLGDWRWSVWVRTKAAEPGGLHLEGAERWDWSYAPTRPGQERVASALLKRSSKTREGFVVESRTPTLGYSQFLGHFVELAPLKVETLNEQKLSLWKD